MKTIRTSDLRDGMRFDKAVYVDGENVFVPPGIPIRQKDIDRLLRWEIAEVRTDGSPVADEPKKLADTPELAVLRETPADRKATELTSVQLMSMKRSSRPSGSPWSLTGRRLTASSPSSWRGSRRTAMR